jgi:DNA polymerase-3 subunit alpha
MGKDIPLSGIFDTDHKRYSEAGEMRSLYDTDPTSRRSSTPPAASRA